MEGKWTDLLHGPLAKHVAAWEAVKQMSDHLRSTFQSFYTYGQTNGELPKLLDESTEHLLDTVVTKPYVMAFVGAPSAGVTSLVNSLVGVRAMVQGEGSPMSRVVELHATRDVSQMRLEMSDLDGSNAAPPLPLGEETPSTLGKKIKDLVSAPDGVQIDAHWHEKIVKIYFNFPTLHDNLVIVDIPSFRLLGGDDIRAHVARYFQRYPPTCIGLVYDNPSVADAEVFAVDTLHNLLASLPAEFQPSMMTICSKFDVRGVSAGLGETSASGANQSRQAGGAQGDTATSLNASAAETGMSLQQIQFEEELAKAYQFFAERELDGFTLPSSFKDCVQWAATSVRDFKTLAIKKNSPEAPIVLAMWHRFMAHLQHMIVAGARRRFHAATLRIGQLCGMFLQFTTSMETVPAAQIAKYRKLALEKEIPAWNKKVSAALSSIIKLTASGINKALKKSSSTHQRLIATASTFALPGLDGQALRGREDEAFAAFRYQFDTHMRIHFWNPWLRRLRTTVNTKFNQLVDELAAQALGKNIALTDALNTTVFVLDPNSLPQFSSGGFSWTFMQQFQIAFSSVDDGLLIDADWKRKRASMILQRIKKGQIADLVNADISQMVNGFLKGLERRMDFFSRSISGLQKHLESLGDMAPFKSTIFGLQVHVWDCLGLLNNATKDTVTVDAASLEPLSYGTGWNLTRAKWALPQGHTSIASSTPTAFRREVMLHRFIEDTGENTLFEKTVDILTTKALGQATKFILEPVGYVDKDLIDPEKETPRSIFIYPYAPSLYEISKRRGFDEMTLTVEDSMAAIANLACLLLSFVTVSGNDSHVPHLHLKNLFLTYSHGRKLILWIPGLDKPVAEESMAASAQLMMASRQAEVQLNASGASTATTTSTTSASMSSTSISSASTTAASSNGPSSSSQGLASSSTSAASASQGLASSSSTTPAISSSSQSLSSGSSASSGPSTSPAVVAGSNGIPLDPLQWGKRPSAHLVMSNPEMPSPRDVFTLGSGRTALSAERATPSPVPLNLHPSPIVHSAEITVPSYMTSLSQVIEFIATITETSSIGEANRQLLWGPIMKRHKNPAQLIAAMRNEEHLALRKELAVPGETAPAAPAAAAATPSRTSNNKKPLPSSAN